jgi:hypothetical protein
MKKTAISIALASIASFALSAPLWAESVTSDKETTNISTTPNESGSSVEMDRNLSEDKPTEQQPAIERSVVNIYSGDYVGKNVISSKGETIGKIDKLVTNNDGQTIYAVVGVGGFYGIGEKDAAIPVSELMRQGVNWSLSGGITEESLKNGLLYEESEFSAFEIRKPISMTSPKETDSNKPHENTDSMPTKTETQGDQSNN